MRIYIGNAIMMLASAVMVYVGTVRDKKKLLIVQSVQFALFTAGNAVLGGWAGVMCNAVSIARNLRAAKHELASTEFWVFLLLPIPLMLLMMLFAGSAGETFTILDWMPVFATIVLSAAIRFDSALALKAAIILGQAMFCAYDITISNYVGCIFDVATLATNVYAILCILKYRKKS